LTKPGVGITSSLVPAVAGLPWPDVVLAKIMALEADETVLFGRGNTRWE